MLFFGLESFDQKFLDNINKGINVKYAIKILQLCKKYDIKTSVSFLFNFPLENLHTLMVTKRLLKKYINLFDHLEFNTFVPTANCKWVKTWDKLNYYDVPTQLSTEKQKIFSDIQTIAKNKLNSSFYLKNYEIWE